MTSPSLAATYLLSCTVVLTELDTQLLLTPVVLVMSQLKESSTEQHYLQHPFQEAPLTLS
jgi:hypothetical protein